MEVRPGAFAGERWTPIPSVACYVPRGKGAFPSVMMMTTVPAVVAGVPEIVVLTPPTPEGGIDAASLFAARTAGVAKVYRLGGAVAVAAAAFGTASVPKVAKIVGPGSPWVVAAKRLVADRIDTGLPAGPSESIVLADATANPDIAALDLLIEAEHGPDSSAFLVTDSREVASRARARLPELIANLGPAAPRLRRDGALRPPRRHRARALLGRGPALRQRLRRRASRGPLRRAAPAPGRHPPCRRDPARPEHADHHRQFLPRPRLRPAHRRLGAHLVGARRPRLHEAHQPRPCHRQGLPGAGPARRRAGALRGLRGARAGAVGDRASAGRPTASAVRPPVVAIPAIRRT